MKEITIEQIVSVFKNFSEEKRLKDIKQDVVNSMQSELDQSSIFREEERLAVEKQIESLIKKDQKLGSNSYLKYNKSKYKKRPNKSAPQNPNKPASVFVGTAGEMAVISELMFNGFNANKMLIDVGVDIVAMKNDQYSYIQVKTSYIENGRIQCQIDENRFAGLQSQNLIYIVVARCGGKTGEPDKNMFFIMRASDILVGTNAGYIKRGQNNICIKIKFDTRTGEPILYDDKEFNAKFFLNNFSYIPQ